MLEAAGCGRTDLPVGDPVFQCADGSEAGDVGCGNITFANAGDYPITLGLNEVEVAELNGDGALDFVVAGAGDSVTIFLNQGNGQFFDGVPFATSLFNEFGSPAGVSGIAIGDINQDGAVDIVVSPARDDASLISVLMNDGHGAFAPGVLYKAGAGPHAVGLGDLDGDGLLDIAVANIKANKIGVLSNLGNGTFSDPVFHGPVNLPKSVVAADIDLDGRLDLVATNYGSNASAFGTALFRNTGGGTFAKPITSVGFGGSRMAVGDMNGDGKPDLASGHGDHVEIRLNMGGFTFGSTKNFFVKTLAYTVAMADLNNDCRPDIAAVGEREGVGVLPNLGDGTLGPSVTHLTDHQPYWVASGDFNGDGKNDLVVTYWNFGLVSVLLNRGCGP